IPYPFGTIDGCFREPPFRVYCEDDHAVYLQDHKKLKVLQFELAQGEVLIQKRIATSCGVNLTGKAVGIPWVVHDGGLADDYPYLTISTKNQFAVVGCGITAIIVGQGENQPDYTVGCRSFCDDVDSNIVEDNSTQCNGNTGCCQASIPGNLKAFQPSFLKISGVNYSGVPCVYAFVVEQNWFKFKTSYAKSMELYSKYRNKGTGVPLVLDLVVGNETCDEAKRNALSYACKATNSSCIDRPSRSGYLCNCSQGYEGNPYLHGGCQDINECDYPWLYPCKGLSIGIGVGSATGFICIVLIAMFLTRRIKHRRKIKLRQKFFILNRGQLLKQLVSQRADIAERMIITLDELEKATNNFDKARELGGGGHGTVYKGILSDLHVVAIKISNIVVQKEIDDFINEVAILSQINHKNVVKLIGCCLETEVPLLVYEFISNGTLYHHLHGEGPRSLSWSNRLRIAAEIANALSYLHSSVTIPIIHRDIKSSNILLDDNLTSKVSDFGASRYIPIEKTALTTAVQGTVGYLDPMYFYTGRLNDKSDVYSFGVMLVELLT
uniref:Protein kinase domain-containing protein n=1 Tax=Oryza glaberrima TaxID=4538 RepID=I1PIE8_ORYGL